MEASGCYERGWAKVVREAGIEVRIVDPKRVAASRCRPAAGQERAIDAEMIAWLPRHSRGASQTYDAAREELQALVKARRGLINLRIRLAAKRTCCAGFGSKSACPLLKNLTGEIAKLEPPFR